MSATIAWSALSLPGTSLHIELVFPPFAVQRAGHQHGDAAVWMRKRKNLQVLRGKDHTVMIAAGGKHVDAAGCLFELLAVRRAAGIGDGKPLFYHASGKSISTEEERCIVRRVMEAAVCDPKVYGGHSLRIGGATQRHTPLISRLA